MTLSPVAARIRGAMLWESRHITLSADHGTATLAFGFDGEPVNALDLASLREFHAALDCVASSRSIGVLVLRSSIPAGFCAGLHPRALSGLSHPAERSAFAWYAQQVLQRFAELDVVSLALIDGPCLDIGLELALACDYRLCIARPATRLGFPARHAFFGGSARVRNLAGRRGRDLIASGQTISGREAMRLGLVDLACSERRARIELRTLIDRLEVRPIKPRRQIDPEGLAAERRAFAATAQLAADAPPAPRTLNPIPPLPAAVGLLGNEPLVDRLAANLALRGTSIIVCGDRSGIFAEIAADQARGFVTPLEAEQALLRVRASDTLSGFDRAGLVFVAPGHDPFRLAAAIRPRTVVCVVRPTGSDPLGPSTGLTVPFPFPRRLVRISFCEPGRVALFPDTATDPDTLAAVTAWIRPFGFSTVVFPAAARLLPRAA